MNERQHHLNESSSARLGRSQPQGTSSGARRTPGGEASTGRWRSSRGSEVLGRLRHRACPRPEDGVQGLHSYGEAADLAGNGDPGCRAAGAVLGERTDTGKVGSPQRSRQRPRNWRPRHGWTEHRRTCTPPEGRQGTSAGWSQHATGRKLRGAAPHILRLFRKGGLPAAARAEHPGQR
jgi:hypothetical protein